MDLAKAVHQLLNTESNEIRAALTEKLRIACKLNEKLERFILDRLKIMV